jgi:hypothetical protein
MSLQEIKIGEEKQREVLGRQRQRPSDANTIQGVLEPPAAAEARKTSPAEPSKGAHLVTSGWQTFGLQN